MSLSIGNMDIVESTDGGEGCSSAAVAEATQSAQVRNRITAFADSATPKDVLSIVRQLVETRQAMQKIEVC